jgi:hypothetical protein
VGPYRQPQPLPLPGGNKLGWALIVAGGLAAAIAAFAGWVGWFGNDRRERQMIEQVGTAASASASSTINVVDAALAIADPPPPPLREPILDAALPNNFHFSYTSPAQPFSPPYTITIDADGSATLSSVRGEGVIAKLKSADLNNFWEMLRALHFFVWPSTGQTGHETDHFPLTLAAAGGSATHSMSCVDACPDGVNALLGFLRVHVPADDYLHGSKKLPKPPKARGGARSFGAEGAMDLR